MKNIRRKFGILFFYLFTIAIAAEESLVTHCQASRSSGPPQVTCFFPKEINKTKTSFCVYHYKSNVTSVVLACNWLDEEVTCLTDEGFQPPQHVSSKFTTTTERPVDGDLACDLLPQDRGSVVRHCRFDTESEKTPEDFIASEPFTEEKDSITGDKESCVLEWALFGISSLLWMLLLIFTIYLKCSKSTKVAVKNAFICRCNEPQQSADAHPTDTPEESPCINFAVESLQNRKECITNENLRLLIRETEKRPKSCQESSGDPTSSSDIHVSSRGKTPDENQPWSPNEQA